MLVSPRDFDSWRQLCDTKTCNYPCILPGSLRLKEKRRIREKSENIEKILCFTALDAIPRSKEAHHLKRRNAETIVFYRPKCDFAAARKCARKDADCVLYRVLRYEMRSQKIGIAESRPKTEMCQNPRPCR